jgi:hypothetical protein
LAMITKSCEVESFDSCSLKNSISFNRTPHFFTDRYSQSANPHMILACDNGEMFGIASYPLLIDGYIISSFANSYMFTKGLCFHRPLVQVYTVNLFLPFARLRLRTSLPPLVDILTRKPWVLFRFVLLKFVRFFFIHCTPVKIIRNLINHNHVCLSRSI